MYQKISAVEAKKIMDKEKDIVIVDVREEDELVEGYIENSLLVPLSHFEDEIEEKVPNKDKTILLYCRSGRRSAIAGNIMEKLGYKKVLDFGGIINWPFDCVM